MRRVEGGKGRERLYTWPRVGLADEASSDAMAEAGRAVRKITGPLGYPIISVLKLQRHSYFQFLVFKPNYPDFAFDLLQIWLSDFVIIRLNQSCTASYLVLHASSDNVVECQLAPPRSLPTTR